MKKLYNMFLNNDETITPYSTKEGIQGNVIFIEKKYNFNKVVKEVEKQIEELKKGESK